MSHYFGFIPSTELQNQCQEIAEKIRQSSDTLLYPLRDSTSLLVTNELIEAALISLVEDLPETDSKATVLKVAHFIKSTVSVLLKQLLGKTSNEQAVKSFNFLTNLQHADSNSIPHLGVILPEDLATNLLKTLDVMENGDHRSVTTDAVNQMTQLVDIIIQNFMEEFLKTLDLGMIKRKAAEMANSGVSKAMHVAIRKTLPSIPANEAKAFAKHYKALIYKA